MGIVKKREAAREKKPFGAKISPEVLEKLKAYSQYVGQPINYCTDRLLYYALESDLEFQAYWRAQHGETSALTEEQTWERFLEMGRTARPSTVSDASTHHNEYLYGPEGKAR